MANKHETLTGLFTDIADAIRAKTGSNEAIVADNFPTEIEAIDTQENLDPELSEQDSIIAELSAILDGKAGVPAEDLDAEMAEQGEIITTQDDLISQISTALAGKSAASGTGVNVETTTVTIQPYMSAQIYTVNATTVEDGEISVYASEETTEDDITLNNIVIGSLILIESDATAFADYDSTGVELLNTITYGETFVFRITGSDAVITIEP